MRLIEVMDTIQMFMPDTAISLCDTIPSYGCPLKVLGTATCQVCPLNADATLSEELYLSTKEVQ